MRALVFLSALALVAGSHSTGTCVIDGAESVSDALDASMFIWASIARCGKEGEQTKCTIGVSSALNSLNKMVNLILKAIDKCDALNTVNKDCGLSMSQLTTSASGISEASAGIAQKCFQGDGVNGLEWHHADAALCVVNVKDAAASVFKVVKAFLKLEKFKPCEKGDTEGCAEKSLAIIGAFAGVGEYLAGSVGHCAPAGEFHGANCGAQATRLVQQLTTFSQDAIDVSQKCAPTPVPPKEELEEITAEQKVLPNGAPAGPPVVTGRTFDIDDDGLPASSHEPADTHHVDASYDVVGDGKPASDTPPAGTEATEWGEGKERLYSASRKQVGSFGPTNVNVMLAASLPLTAIVAFVGGRFYGLRRATREVSTGVLE